MGNAVPHECEALLFGFNLGAPAPLEFSRRDVVRHQLVQRIIAAYEEHRGKSRRVPRGEEE